MESPDGELRTAIVGVLKKKDSEVTEAAVLKACRTSGTETDIRRVMKALVAEQRLEERETEKGRSYRLREDKHALTQEQLLVLQVVERAGSSGVWLRDIKSATSLQQQTLNKALKVLETQKMVKTVKSVQQKTRKLYMAYDLQPTREISGGPWFTNEQEFDHGYVDELKAVILRFIKQKDIADLADIEDSVKQLKISKVPLEPRDIRTLVNALVCDGKIEPRHEHGSHKTLAYKLAATTDVASFNFLSSVPCGVCPNTRRCRPNGIISPLSCPYLTEWLAKPDPSSPMDIEDS